MNRRELLRIIDEFILLNPRGNLYVFLDEITYLPDWYIAIKNIAETVEIERLAIIATGSSPYEIKVKEERLPGRKIEGNEYYIHPLSFREFILKTPSNKFPLRKDEIDELKSKLARLKLDMDSFDITIAKELIGFYDTLEKLLNIYLITGGFPKTITEYLSLGKIRDETYEEIIRLILGDISKAKKSENIALGVLRYVLNHLSSRVDFVTIARDINVHHDTVKEIIELLNQSFVITILYPLDLNKRMFSIRKQKKIFFNDPFLFSSLRRFFYGDEFEDLILEIDKVKPLLLEGLVANAIAMHKEIPHLRERWSFLGYYYDKRGEIDIVYMGKKILGIEVKYTEEVKKRRFPIDVYYATKDDYGVDRIPISLLLALLPKSKKVI